MNLDGKKILVTGSDGFIGSHLVEKLVVEGYDVRAFVLYNSFNSWGWLESVDPILLDKVEVFVGDVRDSNSVRAAMKGCDVVFHLAALIGIPYSYSAPGTYVDTNVVGTLNIVQAANDLGVERVVSTSTSEVYGSAKFVPITEDHPLQGQSPYSASKIGADQIALSFHCSFDTPVTVLRPFNTYGPRQSARAIIPTVITQIAAGAEEIKLGALSPTRDFTFVADTVSGFIAAAQCDEIVGSVTNIGSGFEISIGETVHAIAEVMGKDVKITQDPQRMRPSKSEVERLFAGVNKAKDAFGWEPKFGGLEGFKYGLRETSKWFMDSDNLKYYKADVYNV